MAAWISLHKGSNCSVELSKKTVLFSSRKHVDYLSVYDNLNHLFCICEIRPVIEHDILGDFVGFGNDIYCTTSNFLVVRLKFRLKWVADIRWKNI